MKLGTGYITILDVSDVAVVSAVAPSNPKVDLIWLDISITPNIYKRWTGSDWALTGLTLGDVSDQISKTIPFIDSTHATSTSNWTGDAPFSTLVPGQQITYLLKQVPIGNATLNLTLSGGNTTGAINCYYLGSSRLTTHYGQGNVIRLTYLENNIISGTSYTGWWADANYSSDTFDRVQYNRAILAKSAIASNYFVVSDDSGYFPLTNGSIFDYSKPILWATDNISEGATGTKNYVVYSECTLRNNAPTIALAPQKSVYLKGLLSSNLFTVKSEDAFFTDTPVDDGYVYMLLGQLYSEYQMTLASQHDMYRFDSGIFKSFSQIAYEALNKANEKMDIYFSAPTDVPLPVAVGSLAYDLATRTVWRYEGADADPPWSDVTYTILGQAIEVALQAKSLAESKITAYASATTPTGGKEGDLWYKLTENGRPYVYSGGQWSKLLGNEFTTLENSMSSIVQTLTGGMKIYRQATAPTSGMSVGDLWYNTIDGNACSKYSGTDWVPFGFTNMIAYIDSATDLSNSAKKDQIISTVRGSALYQSDLAGTVKTDAFYSALSAAIAESRQSIITQIDETIGSAVTAEASRAQQVESLIQSILTKYADYLTITTNGLSIGKSGSLFSIFLSDDQITLRQGESDVFRVIDGQIIMTKMKVVDKIAVGNPEDGYTVMDTTNSGLSIVWQATDPFAT